MLFKTRENTHWIVIKIVSVGVGYTYMQRNDALNLLKYKVHMISSSVALCTGNLTTRYLHGVAMTFILNSMVCVVENSQKATMFAKLNVEKTLVTCMSMQQNSSSLSHLR
jgi:hypothetical protein